MAPRRKYKPSDRETVIDMALSRNRVSNRLVAKRLKVDESTIREWRKLYPDFDEAFTEAHHQLAAKINNTARKSLDIRKRRTITKETDDGKIITEDVLPSHNDLAVFAKLGLRGTFCDPDVEKRDDIRRTIIRKFVDGEYTALQATLLLETEGLDVPHTLKLELEVLRKKGGAGGDEAPTVVVKLVNSPDAD